MKRMAAINHLKAVIKASAKLGVNMVTTFIGRDQYKTVEENIELFKKIWPEIIQLAEENNVKVAIENHNFANCFQVLQSGFAFS